jgi:hypothetical protein
MSDTKDITQNIIKTAFEKWSDKLWFQIVFICVICYFLISPILAPFAYRYVIKEDTKEIVSEEIAASDRERKSSHEKGFRESKEFYTQAKAVMKNSINNIGCDYLFLIEYHNGSENIVNGIQFCRFDITLEVISDNTEYVQIDKFRDDIVARYDILLSEELATNKLLFYEKHQFDKVDKYLSHQLSTVDAQSYAIVNLTNTDGVVYGTLLCVSKKSTMNMVAIYECLHKMEHIFNKHFEE